MEIRAHYDRLRGGIFNYTEGSRCCLGYCELIDEIGTLPTNKGLIRFELASKGIRKRNHFTTQSASINCLISRPAFCVKLLEELARESRDAVETNYYLPSSN